VTDRQRLWDEAVSVDVNSLARVRITICNIYIFNDLVAAERAVAAVLGTEVYRIKWKNVSAVNADGLGPEFGPVGLETSRRDAG
jgi:hypothetical protein